MDSFQAGVCGSGEGRKAMTVARRFFLELFPWLVVLFVGISYASHEIKDSASGSRWLDVVSVTVADSKVGEPVIMRVSRTIYSRFHASWIVSVRRVDHDGLELACVSTGESDYLPEAKLPDPLTLNWWTYPVQCKLQPGRYRIDTVWRIDPQGYPSKIVSASSNVFEVRP